MTPEVSAGEYFLQGWAALSGMVSWHSFDEDSNGVESGGQYVLGGIARSMIRACFGRRRGED